MDTSSDNNVPKGIRKRFSQKLYENFVEPLASSKNPPWYDARGVSVGLVVGFGVPVGGHAAALVLLRFFFRYPFFVAFAFTFVGNPLSMVPMYYGYYCIGSYILGKPISMDFTVFEKLMHPVMNKTYFWEAMSAFGELGKEVLVRWSIAAVLLAAIFGLLGYFLTLSIQRNRCRKVAEKLGMQYETYLKRMEESEELNKRQNSPSGNA